MSSDESSVPHRAASHQSAVGHTTGTPGFEEIRFYRGSRWVSLIARLRSNNRSGDGFGQYRSHHSQVQSPAHLGTGHDFALFYSRLDGIVVWLGFLNRRFQSFCKLVR